MSSAYGNHQRDQWVKCRAVSQIACLALFGGFVFFSLLGGIYLPYRDAIAAYTEDVRRSESYIAGVCRQEAVLANLGRWGMEDCAKHARNLEMDIPRAASEAVLKRYNFCPDGNCVVLSFNLVTFVTTFLPGFLICLVLLLVLITGYIITRAYGSVQNNYELPMLVGMALANMKPSAHIKTKDE